MPMSPGEGSSRRGSTRWLSAGLLLLALVGATASADTVTVLDGSTNARANKFDISTTTAGHKGGLLRHEIRTYKPWKSSELFATRAHPRLVAVYIWRPGSNLRGRQDYEIYARFKHQKLGGYVSRVGRRHRRLTGRASVKRFDRYSITFTFSKKAIGNPRYYRWQAVTGYTGRGCPKDARFQFGCDDSAPTGTTKLHRLAKRN
jgi:hypothetical protein